MRGQGRGRRMQPVGCQNSAWHLTAVSGRGLVLADHPAEDRATPDPGADRLGDRRPGAADARSPQADRCGM